MTRTLTDAVHEFMALSPNEALQIFEELAIMREAAGQAICLYGTARNIAENLPPDTSEERKRSALANVMEASAIMREALMEVIKTVATAREFEDKGKDKVSVLTLHHFVDQIVTQAFECFGDDPRVEKFVVSLRDNIKVPDSANGMTTSKPSDDLVASMDQTIPRGA